MAYQSTELTHRLNHYIAYLQEHLPLEKAILFGSYAYGTPREGSDIDLMVLSSAFEEMPYPRRLERLSVLAWRAGVGDIEALGCTPEEFEQASDLSLLGEIRERGIVVYETDSAKDTG
jgi:predicted nucleotidyltransferase